MPDEDDFIVISPASDVAVTSPSEDMSVVVPTTEDVIVSPFAEDLSIIGSRDDLTVTPIPGDLIIDVEMTGPPGRDGANGAVDLIRVAEIDLSGHRVVKAVNGSKANYASALVEADGGIVLGVTTGAAIQGANATIKFEGEMIEPSWNWALGPVFVGADGVLTQAPPSGEFSKQIGVATAPTVLVVGLEPTIYTG